MSLFELRVYVEGLIPWWGPLVVAGIAGVVYVGCFLLPDDGSTR